ncbi:YXWGXW repeat-containing protein [Xenophilus aerolatus]|nr:YXWGXW repeat-containing protein [Xenophilus aerolatus]
MNKLSKITLAAGAAALLSVGAFTVPTAAQAQPVINVQFGPPPPPRVERVPPPRRGYVWAPGHWEWRRGGHVWVPGVWVRARPGYAYRPPEWRDNNGRWEYNRGRWDRDRDGVPDRVDRRPNNPYRN